MPLGASAVGRLRCPDAMPDFSRLLSLSLLGLCLLLTTAAGTGPAAAPSDPPRMVAGVYVDEQAGFLSAPEGLLPGGFAPVRADSDGGRPPSPRVPATAPPTRRRSDAVRSGSRSGREAVLSPPGVRSRRRRTPRAPRPRRRRRGPATRTGGRRSFRHALPRRRR